MVAHMPIMAATERSISPLIMINVMIKAIVIFSKESSNTLIRLSTLKKKGDKRILIKITAIKTSRSKNSQLLTQAHVRLGVAPADSTVFGLVVMRLILALSGPSGANVQ